MKKNKLYRILHPKAVLSTSDYQKYYKKVVEKGSMPSIYVALEEHRFENWVIEISDIKEKNGGLTFGFSVLKTPSQVTKQQIDSSRDTLRNIVADIFLDVIEESYELLN